MFVSIMPAVLFSNLVIVVMLLQEVKSWLTLVIKTIEENPFEEHGKQLTAAYFIILCLAKIYPKYQSVSNSAVLSLIKMIILNPEPDRRSCPDYNFLKRFIQSDSQGYVI